MIHDVGNRILNQAEQKFGKLAISGLIRWIAIFQMVVFVLINLSPPLLAQLSFDHTAIFQGQIWRVFTWILMSDPERFISALFALLIFWFVSNGIEECWGVFRTNVFVVATILCISAICFLPKYQGLGLGFGMMLADLYFYIMFMTFAAALPNYVINLFGVIPVKAKWLGLIDAAIILSLVVQTPDLIPLVLVGLIPFVLVFVPTFLAWSKNRGETAVRRAKFQQTMDPGDSFHFCHICGKTENDDPNLEFRVAADGEEYCVDHLPKKAD